MGHISPAWGQENKSSYHKTNIELKCQKCTNNFLLEYENKYEIKFIQLQSQD